MIRYALPLALTLGVAVAFVRGSLEPAGIEAASVGAETQRTARTGAEIFGINEAVAIPKLWIDRGLISPDQEGAALEEDAKNAVDLGARLVRANTPVYPYLDMMSLQNSGWDWTRADLWVRTVQAAGLDPLMMVGPWPGNQTANYTASYLPKNMDAYGDYVRRVVERYDGDGVDDMPGLRAAVRWWEVDNEPDLHHSRPPRGVGGEVRQQVDPATFQTPAEYARVLVASAKAIRAANPAAKVLSAGFYTIRAAEGRSYVSRLVAEPGVLAAVDIVSVHCYFDEDALEAVDRTLEVARASFPGKPVWVTETSVPARGDWPGQDETWQARMVAGIYGAFLAGGADRVFWHTLADPPFRPGARPTLPFATNSLLRVVNDHPVGPNVAGPGGEAQDKPAGQVYRRLAALLAQTDPSQYREEPASGGRLLWTGDGWLAFWGSPPTPKGAGQVTDLLTGQTRAASGSVSTPAYIARAR